MSSSGTTQSKTKMSVFGGFRFAKMEKKNDVSLPDDSTGSVTPPSAPACPMRAFGFRVHTGVPLTNRPKMGAGSSRGAVVTRASSSVPEGLSDGCTGAPVPAGAKLPIVCGEDVMSPKKHGTTDTAVQENLRWGCEWKTADKICSFNRHYVRASAPSQLQSCSRTTFSGTCFKERFFSRKCLETRLVLFLSLPDAPQFPPCHPPPKKQHRPSSPGTGPPRISSPRWTWQTKRRITTPCPANRCLWRRAGAPWYVFVYFPITTFRLPDCPYSYQKGRLLPLPIQDSLTVYSHTLRPTDISFLSRRMRF